MTRRIKDHERSPSDWAWWRQHGLVKHRPSERAWQALMAQRRAAMRQAIKARKGPA